MGLDVLTLDEVRRVTLRAQGFTGATGRQGGVPGMLDRIGAVQLDTISVLARSHELVAYARLGAVPRQRIERAYWHPARPATFEYWAHAACILPLTEWPYYAFRRRLYRAQGQRWHKVSPSVCEQVLTRLTADGPLTATELGGAKGGGPWWDWSDVKIAAEWLLDIGEVVCVRRDGWRRVYDLPERVLPPALLGAEPTDQECLAHLLGVSARALGVITRADATDYHRLSAVLTASYGRGQAASAAALAEAAAAAGLVPVTIAAGGGGASGRNGPGDGNGRASGGRSGGGMADAWADPEALSWLGTASRERHRVTLLSPFDSLVWDRKRTQRVFGFQHSLEAYVPKEKRVHGYFTMPLLAGGRLAGRVDPAREGTTLVARKVSLERAAAAVPMARALREAASWVGCDDVRVEQVEPAGQASGLAAALISEGASGSR
jgi:uncharacterized protein YcaQ